MSRDFPEGFPKIDDVVRMRNVEDPNLFLDAKVSGRRWFGSAPVLVFYGEGFASLKSVADDWKWCWIPFGAQSEDEKEWKLVVFSD